MDYDMDKYETVAVFNMGYGVKHAIVYSILGYAFYWLNDAYLHTSIATTLVFSIIFVIAHETIHWLVRWSLTGEFPKFGINNWNPCVYSNGYTTRHVAILQTLAPAIITSIACLFWLAYLGTSSLPVASAVFVVNLLGSSTDIEMFIWYLQNASKIAIVGDDGKNTYIKEPKRA